MKETIKDITEIKYNENPQYASTRAFKIWQIKGEFSYQNVKLNFSDTPSGCGPIQMFSYTSQSLFTREDIYNNFKLLLNTLIYDCMILHNKFFSRTPTAITFIQGNSIKEFNNCMEEIGFEMRTYKNIAHGDKIHRTSDKQTFYYLDITKIVDEYWKEQKEKEKEILIN